MHWLVVCMHVNNRTVVTSGWCVWMYLPVLSTRNWWRRCVSCSSQQWIMLMTSIGVTRGYLTFFVSVPRGLSHILHSLLTFHWFTFRFVLLCSIVFPFFQGAAVDHIFCTWGQRCNTTQKSKIELSLLQILTKFGSTGKSGCHPKDKNTVLQASIFCVWSSNLELSYGQICQCHCNYINLYIASSVDFPNALSVLAPYKQNV